MNDEMWKYIIAAIGGLATAWVGKQIDFKGIVRKSEIESKDEIYTSWKEMYETKSTDHAELKAEYAAVRQTVFDLEEKFSQLKNEMSELKTAMHEKEKGYLLQIEKLEDRVEELEEENAMLSDELATLKGGDIID